MKILYAPWRSNYLSKERSNKKTKKCPFCQQPKENNDEKNFIIKRYKNCFVMLNLYPYNAGHLLIVPFSHKKYLNDLTKEEKINLIEILSLSSDILKKTLKYDGINIGTNISKASGGSIPNHLHLHLVPRWFGDTNFLVSTADTKQISGNLKKIYKELKKVFQNKNL